MSACPFQKYRDVFGTPRTGFHAVRIFDLAALDIAGTIVAAWAIARGMRWAFGWVLLILLLIGEILHVLFCVETPVVKRLEVMVQKALASQDRTHSGYLPE